MRRFLDGLYAAAGALAALCLVAIACLVAAQVGGRLLDGFLVEIGLAPTNFSVPSLAEIAGYLLGAATFLALADTLAQNVHIRVDLLTTRLPDRARQVVDGLAAVVGAGIAGFATYATGAYAWKSYSFGDVSYGMVPVPLALPQASLALGLAVFTIALLDEAVRAFAGRDPIAGHGGEVAGAESDAKGRAA